MQGQKKYWKSGLAVAGFGFAMLFAGCNQSDVTSATNSQVNPTTSSGDEIALRMVIKNTPDCKTKQEALAAALKGVKDSSSASALKALHDGFVLACVDTTQKLDNDKGENHPPELKDDPISHCHWMVSSIGKTDEAMTMKYNRVCPADCKTLDTTKVVSDSAQKAMDRICIETKVRHEDNDSDEHLGKRDGDHERKGKDSTKTEEGNGKPVIKPLPPVGPVREDGCLQLRKQIEEKDAKKDTTEREAVKNKMHVFCDDEKNEEKKDIDSVEVKHPTKPEPKPKFENACDSLELQIDKATGAALTQLKAAFVAQCREKDPDPKQDECAELKMRMSKAKGDDADALKKALAAKCPDTVPAK